MELLVALKSGGTNIAVDYALETAWGYAVALDMTLRDLQGEAKKTAVRGKSAKRSNVQRQSACSYLPQMSVTLAVDGLS